jgi:hypothetical protein
MSFSPSRRAYGIRIAAASCTAADSALHTAKEAGRDRVAIRWTRGSHRVAVSARPRCGSAAQPSAKASSSSLPVAAVPTEGSIHGTRVPRADPR